MPERVVETCVICGAELSHDDHKASEHGEDWAHDECLALEEESRRRPHADSAELHRNSDDSLAAS